MSSSRTDEQVISPQDKFLLAAKSGAEAEVNAYIKANENNPAAINYASEGSGNTALILAAGFGHEAVVKALLTVTGIEIDKKNNAGLNALTFAQQRKQIAIVSLLKNPIQQHAANSSAITIKVADYLNAAKNGDVAKIRQYIQENQSNRDAINIKDPETHDTALILAARSGREETIDVLVKTGVVNVHATNKQGDTAASIANRNGHADIAIRLTELAQVTQAATTSASSVSATSDSSVDDDGDQEDALIQAQIKEDHICPVTRMVFFNPVTLVKCGHTIEGDCYTGENGCAKLDKCPLCRKDIVREFKVRTPEDVALSYKLYMHNENIKNAIDSELQKNPKLYSQSYFNSVYLKKLVEENKLHTDTGKKLVKILENAANYLIESIPVLMGHENGLKLLNSNTKMRQLIGQQIRKIRFATDNDLIKALDFFSEWSLEEKAEVVKNYLNKKTVQEQQAFLNMLAVEQIALNAQLQYSSGLRDIYLAQAANAGDLNKVKELVAHGADINSVLGVLIAKQKSALLWWLHDDKAVREKVTKVGMQAVISEGKYQGKTVADALLRSKKGCQLLIEDERLQALCPAEVEGKTMAEWLNAKKAEQNFSQSGFFATALSPDEAKKKFEAKQAKKILECVLFPHKENIDKLKAMAKTMPQCFFIKATAQDQAMDLAGNRRTIEDWSPYQAMFGTSDNDLLAELKDDLDKYLATIEDGNKFARDQVKEKFPNAFDEDGKGFDFPPSAHTDKFERIATAISADQQLKNTGIPSSATQALLVQLQTEFKPGVVKTGHHFNMNDVIKAREIYDANFMPWDDNQLRFFSKNVIGFLQRLETGVYLQSDRTGLVDLVGDNKKPLQRDYEVVNYVLDVNGKKKTVLLPLAVADSVSVLGKDFVVESYYGGQARRCALGVRALRGFCKKLMSSKNSELVKLMPRRGAQRYPESRGCVIQ